METKTVLPEKKEEAKGPRVVVLRTPEEVRKEFTERPFYGPSKVKQTVGIFD